MFSLKKLFFLLSPIVRFTVFGNSMQPTLVEGQSVVVQKKWFFCSLKTDDIVVVKDPRNGRLLLKRIKQINRHSGLSRIRSWMHFVYQDDVLYVVGDNKKESTDSRHFGWILKNKTIGKVIAS